MPDARPIDARLQAARLPTAYSRTRRSRRPGANSSSPFASLIGFLGWLLIGLPGGTPLQAADVPASEPAIPSQLRPAPSVPTAVPPAVPDKEQNRAPTDDPAADPGPITVTASVRPATVKVGEQILLVVQVAAAAPPRGHLETPRLEDARMLLLGEDRDLEPPGAAGAARHRFVRRYAIFPTVAGTLSIPPILFEHYSAGSATPRRARSAPLAVNVEPIPAGRGDGPWLPARSLELGEAGPARLRLAPGQVVERMITLRAEGLMAADLPPLPLAIPFQLEVRAEPPRLWNALSADGVVGHRTERVLIGAAEPGVTTLTTAPLRWWDTAHGRWETATLPDWQLNVVPLASVDRRDTPTWRSGPVGAAPEQTGATASGDAAANGWGSDRWLLAVAGWWQALLRGWPWLLVGLGAFWLGARMIVRRST